MGHGPLSPEELTEQEELKPNWWVEQRMEDEKVRQFIKGGPEFSVVESRRKASRPPCPR